MSPKDVRALVGSVGMIQSPACPGHGNAAARGMAIAARRVNVGPCMINGR